MGQITFVFLNATVACNNSCSLQHVLGATDYTTPSFIIDDASHYFTDALKLSRKKGSK